MVQGDVLIRKMRPTDYPSLASLSTRAHPFQPARSTDMFRHMVEIPDDVGPTLWLVADAGPAPRGYGMLRRFPTSQPLWVYVAVDPAFGRRGIGSRILGKLLAAARGVDEVAALVFAASPGGPSFAAMHGFTEVYRARESALDLTGFDPDSFPGRDAELRRDGITLVSMDEVDDPTMRRELYELASAALADTPSPDPYLPDSYDHFVRAWFESPRAHLPTLVLALRGGQPVAFSNLTVENGDAGYNNGTGVARAFRGRGLGLAVKVEALSRAKQWGVREVRTDNDTDNAPMLAINAKLGYRPLPDLIRYVKRLDEGGARQ